MTSLTGTQRYRILISYWYFKDKSLTRAIDRYYHGQDLDIFVDSGGFSAMTQGHSITLTEYANWVKGNLSVITTYANLDVIGDPEATYNNQKRLEDMGLNPIPVFHQGSSFKYLERYIDEGYKYIALGGQVGSGASRKKIMQYLVTSFKLGEGRVAYHSFGNTNFEVMRSFRWYSIDSSTWSAGVRFGKVAIFDRSRGVLVNINIGQPNCYKYSRVVRQLGFDPDWYIDRRQNLRIHNLAIGAVSYRLLEGWLRGVHGEVRVPNDPTSETGVKIYLADSTTNDTSKVLGYLLSERS